MKKIVVDIYRLTDEELKEKDLYYKNRIVFYDYTFKQLEDCGLREEHINNYYIGQILEY